MKRSRGFVALGIFLFCLVAPASLHSQTCPTTSPQNPTSSPLTFGGSDCVPGTTTSCLVNKLVSLQIPSTYTVQACDALSWFFGDGTSATVTGSGTTTHLYARTGFFSPQVIVSNSLGTVVFFGTVAITSTPGCPTTYPPTPTITWSGPTCSSNISNSPCALGQAVTFTISPYFSGTLEACDRATIDFGDGSTTLLPSGTFTTTHTYTTPGRYNIAGTLANDFSTNSTFNLPQLFAGNGIVTLASSIPDFMEGSVAHIPVTRNTSSGAMSLNYATSDGTARAGQHYTATSGTLSFSDGQATGSIDVPLIDDSFYNGRLTFQVSLSNPTNGYIVYPNTATIGITDNDIPTISLVDSTYSVKENAGQLTVTVKRTGDPSKIVSVSYSVGCCNTFGVPSGIQNVSGTLVFVANENLKTFSAPLIDDNLYEGVRVGSIQLNNVNGGTFPSCCSSTASLVIQDDEPRPFLTLQPLKIPEGNAGNATANVVAALSQPMSSDLLFSWSTSDGSAKSPADYSQKFATARIPAGATSTTLPVTISGNTKVEPDKTFVINATNVFIPPCCTPTNQSTSDVVQPATVTILNDDVAMTPTDMSLEVDRDASMLVNLGLGSQSDDTVTLASSDPSIAKVPATVAIAAGQRSVNFRVTAIRSGSVLVTATLPNSLGGVKLTSQVHVYEGTSLVFSPSRLSLRTGGTGTVQVSVDPPLSGPLTLFWTVADPSKVSAPVSTVVDSGQAATVTFKGLAAGSTIVTATTGADHGNVPFFLPVDVADAGPSITVAAVNPQTGPAAGGTLVTVTGDNLRADCRIYFGDIAAGQLVFINASTEVAVTPAHHGGTVDVKVVCGDDSGSLAGGFTFVGAARDRPVHH